MYDVNSVNCTPDRCRTWCAKRGRESRKASSSSKPDRTTHCSPVTSVPILDCWTNSMVAFAGMIPGFELKNFRNGIAEGNGVSFCRHNPRNAKELLSRCGASIRACSRWPRSGIGKRKGESCSTFVLHFSFALESEHVHDLDPATGGSKGSRCCCR